MKREKGGRRRRGGGRPHIFQLTNPYQDCNNQFVVNAEIKLPIRRCFFFAGLFGTQKGIAETNQALESVYGRGNVVSVESLVSSDRSSAEKYRIIAHRMLEWSKDRVDFILHSGGALEFAIAFCRLGKAGEERLLQGVERFRFFLISPAGFYSGFFDQILSLRRLIRLAFAMNTDGFYRGIDSLSVQGPLLKSGNIQDYIDAVRKAVSERSSMISCDLKLSDLVRKINASHCPESKKKHLELLDSHILSSALSAEAGKVSRGLSRRGRYLSAETILAFKGQQRNHVQGISRTVPEWLLAGTRSSLEIMRMFLKLILTARRKNPESIIAHCTTSGAMVLFFVPEFDVAWRTKDLRRISKRLGISRTFPLLICLPLLTHAGFAISPATLADAISHFQE